MPEVLLTSFMTSIGFSAAEIFKMLLIVVMNFVFIAIVTWRVRRPLISFFRKLNTALESVPEMRSSMDRLNSTLQEHIVQTDLRMTEGDERFKRMEHELSYLKQRVDGIDRKGEK